MPEVGVRGLESGVSVGATYVWFLTQRRRGAECAEGFKLPAAGDRG